MSIGNPNQQSLVVNPFIVNLQSAIDNQYWSRGIHSRFLGVRRSL
jgi:hypothetical protein